MTTRACWRLLRNFQKSPTCLDDYPYIGFISLAPLVINRPKSINPPASVVRDVLPRLQPLVLPGLLPSAGSSHTGATSWHSIVSHLAPHFILSYYFLCTLLFTLPTPILLFKSCSLSHLFPCHFICPLSSTVPHSQMSFSSFPLMFSSPLHSATICSVRVWTCRGRESLPLHTTGKACEWGVFWLDLLETVCRVKDCPNPWHLEHAKFVQTFNLLTCWAMNNQIEMSPLKVHKVLWDRENVIMMEIKICHITDFDNDVDDRQRW